jgi:probable F420-dependent oxidoreductase
VDLGVNLPTMNVPNASVNGIVQIAEAAEQLGYASVWTFERLLYPTADIPQPGGPPRPLPPYYKSVYDPLETLAFIAARTRRVHLGTSVVDALFHVPLVLAKRYATLDQFSAGRVIAGVGQGWMEQEFATANVPPSRKGAGMSEFVAAMRAAWGPDPVHYTGRFYTIPESIVNPKPLRASGIPIIFGSMTPGGIQRAAEVADGLNPIAFSRDSLSGTVAAFRDAARAAGRDAAQLAIHVRVNTVISAAPLPDSERPYLGGSADQIAADLAELVDLNLTSVFVGTGYAPSLADEARRMEELMRAAEPVIAR